MVKSDTDGTVYKKMNESNGVAAVIATLKHQKDSAADGSDDDASESAVGVINALCDTKEQGMDVIKLGGVEALVVSMKGRSADAAVVAASIGAMTKLSNLDGGGKELSRRGATKQVWGIKNSRENSVHILVSTNIAAACNT